MFANHDGIYTLEGKALNSQQNGKILKGDLHTDARLGALLDLDSCKSDFEKVHSYKCLFWCARKR